MILDIILYLIRFSALKSTLENVDFIALPPTFLLRRAQRPFYCCDLKIIMVGVGEDQGILTLKRYKAL